jgi:hypothetical protein
VYSKKNTRLFFARPIVAFNDQTNLHPIADYFSDVTLDRKRGGNTTVRTNAPHITCCVEYPTLIVEATRKISWNSHLSTACLWVLFV